MKNIRIILMVLSLHLISSCSWKFDACIRNLTDAAALVDVYLLDIRNMKTLPNQIRMTNRVINLERGYKRFLDSTQNVTWVDINHFRLEINPHTTVDLSDMAGIFINGTPRNKIMVIASSAHKTDTLLNGEPGFAFRKLNYKGRFFTHILYHDITDQEAPSITTTISPFTPLSLK
ncbi:MAG: hypothetical protein M9904_15530 [Chitinophagaceae bacterium]|nr:hypothetical protein [Chitinophagaceae bacterium]